MNNNQEQQFVSEQDAFAMGEFELSNDPEIENVDMSDFPNPFDEGGYDDSSDDSDSDPDEQDDPGQTDDDDDDLFEDDDDPNDDGDDPLQSEEDELESLNKKLGTDFKSLNDLKKALKLEDENDEQSQQDELYNKSVASIQSLENLLEYNDEQLTREYYFSLAAKNGKDIRKEEVKEEVEDKIESLKDSNTLQDVAQGVRATLKSSLEKHKTTVSRIESEREEKKQKEIARAQEELQESFAEIFSQKEFLGVQLTKEKIKSAYKSIKSNEFFEKVNNNPRMLAKLALFVQEMDVIQKRASSPTYSDGVKDFADQIGLFGKGEKRSVAEAGKGTGSQGGSRDLVNKFTA